MASSFTAVAHKVFGSKNDRELKRLRPKRRRNQRPRTARSRPRATIACASESRMEDQAERDRGGRGARGGDGRGAARGLRGGARGRPPHARPAPLRRPANRRDGAPSGQNRRDEDRRGQDAGRHAAGRAQRADRPRRAYRHGQRLPGAARRRVDGPHLHVSRPHRRRGRARRQRPGAQGRLRLRHHLRPEQRVRLRLPARQHEVQPGGLRPAPA